MINESRPDLWLLELLHQGEANAIKGNTFRQLAGFNTIRELRREIERERNAGAVILTSGAGYFLPTLDEAGQLTEQGYRETQRFCATHRAKAEGTRRSAQSAELALEQYRNGQLSMFGGDVHG